MNANKDNRALIRIGGVPWHMDADDPFPAIGVKSGKTTKPWHRRLARMALCAGPGAACSRPVFRDGRRHAAVAWRQLVFRHCRPVLRRSRGADRPCPCFRCLALPAGAGRHGGLGAGRSRPGFLGPDLAPAGAGVHRRAGGVHAAAAQPRRRPRVRTPSGHRDRCGLGRAGPVGLCRHVPEASGSGGRRARRQAGAHRSRHRTEGLGPLRQ